MKLNSLFCSFFKTFTFLSKYLLFLLGMGIQGELLPQEFNLVASYPSIKQFVAEDSFLKKYSIENGQVKQISQDSTIIIYSNKQFGSVSEIDVSDPLNIIVFFRDFGVVTILDNNLSEKSIVLPRQMHENDLPSQVCFSSRHGFWAFFPNSFQLARFNFRGDRTQISEDLNFNAGLYDQVLFMQESEEMIFLYANGIWVFDLYTNFLYRIKHIQTPLIQVKGKKIFYIINDRMHVYDFFLKQEDVFLLPEKEIKNFFIKNNQTVYLQTSLSLKEYNHTGTFY